MLPRCFVGSAIFLLLLTTNWANAQAPNFPPPPAFPPGDDLLKQIRAKTDKLGQTIEALRKQGLRDPLLSDLEIHHRAGVMMLELQEFYKKDSGTMTLSVLDRGLMRAAFAAQGEFPWVQAVGQTVVRGYRSRIDGTVQPVAVTYPASYGKDPRKRWRVDVVLHGRNSTLTEAGFLHSLSDKPVPKDQDHFVRVDVFGRGNNAYRWAGETDVFEAVEAYFQLERHAGRGQLLDANRVVLRGFSMGGAGTWHLGLHWPDRWCAMGPGAGFTTTHGYVGKLPSPLASPKEECLRIYDAVGYVQNAFNIPLIAYSGEIDPQKLAADNIAAAMAKLGMEMKHVIAPKLAHVGPAGEYFKKLDTEFKAAADAGKPEYPNKIRFITYTMKYPGAFWVAILGLHKHYEPTQVDADRTETGFLVKTKNVRALHLTLPLGATDNQEVVIDGQKITVRPWGGPDGIFHVYLSQKENQWHATLPQKLIVDRMRNPQKIHGLQGPIEDAFAEGFLCVRGTGKAWHEATKKYTDARLERLRFEWTKHWRGTLPIKDDVDVTAADIAEKHLILFGDPGSNSLIAHTLDGLPLKWTPESVEMGKGKGASQDHVPVLIQPNPLNPQKYVVFNTGLTLPTEDYTKTNAMLFPRLGDYGLLQLRADEKDALAHEVRDAGLFDEYWRVAK